MPSAPPICAPGTWTSRHHRICETSSASTPLRIATSNEALLVANLERSEQLLEEMWAIAEDVARAQPSDVTALFIESLNEVIDLHTSRFVAGVYARVPPTILLLLVAGVILSLGLVGYNAGLSEKRSPIIAIVLVIALGATCGWSSTLTARVKA